MPLTERKPPTHQTAAPTATNGEQIANDLQPGFYRNTNGQVNMMNPYLQSTVIIDWHQPDVSELAKTLTVAGDQTETVRKCFEWVRDQILHSRDHEQNPVTCRASDVLRHRTGYCYAKSHLLAALLRANQIPAGLCYQRLSINDRGGPYSLHGFNAIQLSNGDWYRVDPRGNRPGINALFTPPVERLAFPLQSSDEFEFENIFANPLDCVVSVLQGCCTWQEVVTALPDVPPEMFAAQGLLVRARGTDH